MFEYMSGNDINEYFNVLHKVQESTCGNEQCDLYI